MPRVRGSDGPPHGRRETRKHATRRDLLLAGRRLFGREGLYESRIEDLSRDAGIAKGTLYGYFANKQELVEAVVSAGFSEMLGHVLRAAQDARTHEEVVARVAEAHLSFFEENADLVRILHQVRGLLKFERSDGTVLRRLLEKYLEALAHVLALQLPAGRRRGRDQLASATLLYGAVSGIASARAALRTPPRRAESRATVRAVVALVAAYQDTGARGMRGPAPAR